MVLAIFTLVSFWFYWDTYWSQIAYDRSQSGWAVTGEIRASEWGIEQILGKLDRGENPFSKIDGIMYPFGVDIVASDPGLAFLVAPWRYFFSVHQALILVIMLGMIGGGFGMYILLRETGTSKMTSFLIGLAYGNNTFLLTRLGHPGYLASFWIFPWFFWIWQKFLRSNQLTKKIIFAIWLVVFYVFCLWLNFYYFVILNIGIGILSITYMITRPGYVWEILKKNIGYIPFSIAVLMGISWIWFQTLMTTLKFSEVARPLGWGGAIEFSADLFNVFFPSQYNYYYGELIPKIALKIKFLQGIFENYNYPGILLLIGMALIFYQIIRKRKWKVSVLPYFVTAAFFWILTLGPFLQVAGRMYLNLEEQTKVVLPLPFAVLHYLPYFNNLRVPGRLAMGMIFFGLLAVAMLIDKLSKRIHSKRLRYVLWTLLLVVVILDQRPVTMRLEDIAPRYPANLYDIIRKDPQKSAVLVIPFTVRDGLIWFGEYDAVNMNYDQTYIGKPLIGGYSGRIPDYIKEYYRSNPFVGKLGRLIDLNLASNPFMTNVASRDPWKESLAEAEKAVDFLGIKYVVITKSSPYTCNRYEEAENYLVSLGFTAIKDEGNYRLYERPLTKKDYTVIELGADDDNIQLGMGWWNREFGHRWVQKRSSVLLKNSEPDKYSLKLIGQSYLNPQTVTIYIDERIIDKELVATTTTEIKSAPIKLEAGIHIVQLIFQTDYKPSELFPGNLDSRNLAAWISHIGLEKSQ